MVRTRDGSRLAHPRQWEHWLCCDQHWSRCLQSTLFEAFDFNPNDLREGMSGPIAEIIRVPVSASVA